MEAPDKITEIKAIFTAIAAFGTALWGWLGWAIIALFLCIVLDYFSGTWAALKNGEWSSQTARQGLWHKLGEILALLVAMFSDLAVKVILETGGVIKLMDFNYPHIFTLLVTMWYIFTELGSIIENCGQLGAPIPKFLKKAVRKLRDATEDSAPIGEQESKESDTSE